MQPRITEAAAEGIISNYPTLRSLVEAYEDLGSENGRNDPTDAQDKMLSNCQVSHRTDGQLSGRSFDKGLSRRE